MLVPIVLLIASHVLIPTYLIVTLLRAERASRYDWLVQTLTTAGYLAFFFIIGRWDWVSIYLRYAWIATFAVVAVISYRRVRDKPFFVGEGRGRWLRHPGALLELAVALGLLGYALSGFFYPGGAVELTFPLQDGRYYVAHGGNAPIINYHNPSEAQRFALDISELNAAGIRTQGIYPRDLDRYVIFGAAVHSPCDGEVTDARDGLPDHIPPGRDTEQLAGNYVMIACEVVEIVLAHLREGSVQVEPGDAVTTGQVVGEVGNSGHTTEPHLHIHAVTGDDPGPLGGTGVPMTFGGRFPKRNAVFRR